MSVTYMKMEMKLQDNLVSWDDNDTPFQRLISMYAWSSSKLFSKKDPYAISSFLLLRSCYTTYGQGWPRPYGYKIHNQSPLLYLYRFCRSLCLNSLSPTKNAWLLDILYSTNTHICPHYNSLYAIGDNQLHFERTNCPKSNILTVTDIMVLKCFPCIHCLIDFIPPRRFSAWKWDTPKGLLYVHACFISASYIRQWLHT